MGPTSAAGLKTFEICVMNAVVNGQAIRLTFNSTNDLTPTWSPDGQEIVFHQTPSNQLWTMHADGSGQRSLTAPPGLNLLATTWGASKLARGGAKASSQNVTDSNLDVYAEAPQDDLKQASLILQAR